jgi:hypothetical protein
MVDFWDVCLKAGHQRTGEEKHMSSVVTLQASGVPEWTPTEAERAYAWKVGLLYPNKFEDEEMEMPEVMQFWLDVRQRFAASQQKS